MTSQLRKSLRTEPKPHYWTNAWLVMDQILFRFTIRADSVGLRFTCAGESDNPACLVSWVYSLLLANINVCLKTHKTKIRLMMTAMHVKITQATLL